MPLRLLCLLLWLLPPLSYADDLHIGILVFDQVLTGDVTGSAEVFGAVEHYDNDNSYQVSLINVDAKNSITTHEGLTLQTDATIDDTLALDVLIIPSAYDMQPLIDNPKLAQFIQQHAQRVTWLASHCSGAFLLGALGLLDGYQATTWFGGESDLAKAYPQIEVVHDQNIVIDGNRITSNGSVVSYPASLVLLAKLTDPSLAKKVFEHLQMERLIPWSQVTDVLTTP